MGWRVNGEQGKKLKRKEDGTTHAFFTGGHTNFNLVLRFSHLPVERTWLGPVMCLQESGRLQTNDWGRGADKCEIVSAER